MKSLCKFIAIHEKKSVSRNRMNIKGCISKKEIRYATTMKEKRTIKKEIALVDVSTHLKKTDGSIEKRST